MGVVLYEMLSLVQPFAASNVAALIMKIVNAEPPPLPAECRAEVCDATWPYLAILGHTWPSEMRYRRYR